MSGIDVEGVLREHIYALGHSHGSICMCGFVPDVDLETLTSQQGYHRAHVAAVLRAQIEGALAEAWDEGWNSAAWRSYKRTGVAIDNATEARSRNPYRAAHLSDTERAGGAE